MHQNTEEHHHHVPHSAKEFLQARDTAFARFPLLFTLLGAFGVTLTFYGLDKLIQKIPFLANNPVVSLVVGLVILVLTGKLYKKLG